MALDPEQAKRGLGTFLEVTGDRMAEVAVVALVAGVKAWQTYQTRRRSDRPGRRAVDRSTADLQRRMLGCEAQAGELAATVDRLAARVRLLEGREDTGAR